MHWTIKMLKWPQFGHPVRTLWVPGHSSNTENLVSYDQNWNRDGTVTTRSTTSALHMFMHFIGCLHLYLYVNHWILYFSWIMGLVTFMDNTLWKCKLYQVIEFVFWQWTCGLDRIESPEQFYHIWCCDQQPAVSQHSQQPTSSWNCTHTFGSCKYVSLYF